ncbi:hypothetical protein HanHA300_Chr11g0395851 [Helianthus annuus]|nr:hypothetical protein HanHA300_Chr11g0395851 [Helianthus annuus]KAJ0684910.1 hypothetical protein HanLR1_Chr11g0396531 [Helianthus annuus]KAJ0688835.1 hypothetical protein HanOQP8_Chr11g0398731 [Helianthus annuus]
MERFGGGGGDTLQLDSNSSGGAVFDASQYAFFGNEVLEEIELGGLEDDGDLLEAKFEDDEHLLEQEEASHCNSIPDSGHELRQAVYSF